MLLTICAMLATALYLLKQNALLNYITGVFSAINGFVTFLVSMVLVGEYHVISNAWPNLRTSTVMSRDDLLCYNPIPIFFIMFSGIFSMVTGLFTLTRLDNLPEDKGYNNTPVKDGEITPVSLEMH